MMVWSIWGLWSIQNSYFWPTIYEIMLFFYYLYLGELAIFLKERNESGYSGFWCYPCWQVIDSISASKNELGPWSLDLFRRNHVSSSWIIEGLDDQQKNASSIDVKILLFYFNLEFLRLYSERNAVCWFCVIFFFFFKSSQTASDAEQKTSLTKSEKNTSAGDFKRTDEGKQDDTGWIGFSFQFCWLFIIHKT